MPTLYFLKELLKKVKTRLMAKRNAKTEKIYNCLEPIIEELGFELIDVVYERENGKLFLRVLVDKIGGITIDDCAVVNEKIDPIIDNELKLTDHDYFEVSSPGLDRPLTEAKEFRVYQGQLVEIRLYQKYDDKKMFVGKLVSGDDKQIVINEETTDHKFTFELKDVAKIARVIRFN